MLTKSCPQCGAQSLVQRPRSIGKSCPSCARIKHGHARTGKATKTWFVWQSMLARCTSETHRYYSSYGGRGIQVCDRWRGKDGFANFLADMGDKPAGMSIDRIDNDGNYEPGNCRWASATTQGRNRRNTKLTYELAEAVRSMCRQGAVKADIARAFGIAQSTVRAIELRKTWRTR